MQFSQFFRRALRVFLIFLGSTCALNAWAVPLDVTDALGRKVKINTPVQRVVVNFNYEEFTAIAGKDNWTKVVDSFTSSADTLMNSAVKELKIFINNEIAGPGGPTKAFRGE